MFLSAVPLPRVLASPTGTLYLLGLALALGTVGAAYAIGRSRLGFGLFAIHDDEDVAEVMGVPTYGWEWAVANGTLYLLQCRAVTRTAT